ncbi:MAG TPA: YXWGXW repeat-containing protein [Kofleriaceae bacterium]|nr:YXWGXW repeat-containing protein [Kofleriaceae bacterium]
MRTVAVLVLVAACGSSAKQSNDPKRAQREAAEARRKQIEAMKPASPYVLRDRTAYRPSERCGQGPYRFEADSLAAKYGERTYVYACGKHEIKGMYRVETRRPKTRTTTDESGFGFDRQNAACKAKATAATGTGGSGGGGGAATGGTGASGGGATASAPASVQPVALERTSDVPTDCTRTQVLDFYWTSTDDHVAVDGHFTIDVWSDEPNDLEGLVFVVERHGVRPDMTPEQWQAYRDADKAYDEAYAANLDLDVKAGLVELIEQKVTAPPPPPPRAETQPPKPSVHARWIPGYWLYAETKFHWIAGLWDVPEEDIQRELTVEAPTPPPAEPAHVEAPVEPQPTKTAVWTPGVWQWDGRVYVWVPGAWRIPPDAQHTWQKPTWNVQRGRAVFVPGGWRVRVRLGR